MNHVKTNKQQKRAIDSKEKHNLIIAGAGAGKTFIVTRKIKRLVEKYKKPEKILAVTFTNKAVNELRDRVEMETNHVVKVNTFHRLGKELIEEFGPKGIRLMTTNEKKDIMRLLMNENPHRFALSKKQKKIETLISLLKNKNIDSLTLRKGKLDAETESVFQEYIQTEEQRLGFFAFYMAYEKTIQVRGLLDMNDLILFPLQLAKQNPHIKEQIQAKFDHVFVDEFQDINDIQFELVQLVANKAKTLTAVGDDFQSIYRFQGSNIRNILNFKQVYPNATVIKFEQNYRSSETILLASNQLIKHNKNQEEKEMFSTKKTKHKIKVMKAKNVQNEFTRVAKEIKRIIRDEQEFSYGDIAVLYRSNNEKIEMEEAFEKEQIPFHFTSHDSAYETSDVKKIMHYLTFMLDSTNKEAFEAIVNFPKRGVGPHTLEKMNQAKTCDDYLVFLQEMLLSLSLHKQCERQLELFVSFMAKVKETSRSQSILETLKMIMFEVYVGRSYNNVFVDESTRDSLKELLSLAKTYEVANGRDIKGFIAYIDRVKTCTKPQNKVHLQTVHSSKGLEFKAVFMVGMRERNFPISYAKTQEAIEEERRLAYVGMTRAKELLYMSYPELYLNKDGKTVPSTPSRFIQEFDASLKEYI